MNLLRIFLFLILIKSTLYAEESSTEKKISLGNLVWFDADKNGKQDQGESGIEGVLVELYTMDEILSKSVRTNSDGEYRFENLEYGGYYLKFYVKEGFKITYKHQDGIADTENSDADSLTGKTDPLTPILGENNHIDVGMYHLSKPSISVKQLLNEGNIDNILVGDTITWRYTLKNSGNVPLTNIVVRDEQDNNITECSGNGSLSLLNPRQTLICTKKVIAILGSHTSTIEVTAQDPEGKEIKKILSSSYVGIELVVQKGSISNSIWLDTNRDGIHDTSELSLENIEVKLFDKNSQEIDTIKTDELGNYRFSDLISGSYYIRFSIPSNYTLSSTASTLIDKDGKTATFELGEGEALTRFSVGLYPSLMLVGNRIWYDTNRDGIQDSNEQESIKDVTVKLFDVDNKLISETKTRASGFYEFKDIAQGRYYILFEIPKNYILSPQKQGTNKSTDSDANVQTGKTEIFTLVAGVDNRTIDMGLYHSMAKVGDRVWYDANKNGLQDKGENGLANVTVKLYDIGKKSAVAETKTTATGIYVFEDIAPSEYYIMFIPPVAYTITQQHRGENDHLDSDANQDGKTANFVVESGTQNSNIDMGVYQSVATLGNRVWNDSNHDGVQDKGEVGVKDIQVLLSSTTDSEFKIETLTDENGNYLFTHLPAGEYALEFKGLPYGYLITQKDVDSNSNDLSDSDVFLNEKEKIVTDVMLIKAGSNELSLDMGIYKTVSLPGKAVLGNLVWEDYNKDGVQDIGERGVSNVSVTLFNYDTDEKIATIVTDENGLYEFVHLDPENAYYLQFTLPEGYVVSPQDQEDDVIDSDVDESGKSEVIHLDPDQMNSSVDMGIHYKGSAIGDRVWYDENRGVSNGIQEENEHGVSDVIVTLYNDKSEQVRQTQTNASGAYHFTNIPKGRYTLGFSGLPDGYIFTQSEQGKDEALDSDVNSNGKTEIFFVDGVHNLTNLDVGIKSLSRGELLNDVKRGVTGRSVQIDVFANDIEGSHNFNISTLRIASGLEGSILTEDGKRLLVPDEGLWKVDGTTGKITFIPNPDFIGDPSSISYTVQDVEGNELGADVEVNYPPVANDDRVNGQISKEITIYVTDNDKETSSPLDKPSVRIIDPENGDEVESLNVDGQGLWITNNDGSITFRPDELLENSPTPIQYSVKEQDGDNSNRATVTIIYPDAVDDIVTISAEHGLVVTIDVALNDSNNTISKSVTLGCGEAGATELVVKHEGVWRVNEYGQVTFNANDGFKSEPTDIQYTVKLLSLERSNCATVDIRYRLLTLNDRSTLNAGGVSLINILANDYGSLDPESVHLIVPANAPKGITLSDDSKEITISNQGTWSVNSRGVVRFLAEDGFDGLPFSIRYSVENREGSLSNESKISFIEGGIVFIANDDKASINGGSSIRVDILENDNGDIKPSSVHIIASDGSYVRILEIKDVGIWKVNDDGSISFTGVVGYVGTPSPIEYILLNDTEDRSQPATITITGECVCKAYEESIPAMGKIAALIAMLLTMLWGSFLLNEEENKI